jgi:hypothetical protein
VGAPFGVEVAVEVEVEVEAAPVEPEDVVLVLPEEVSEAGEVTAGVVVEPVGVAAVLPLAVAVGTAPLSSAMTALEAQDLTLSGRLRYQSGICPCSICWTILAACVGSARAAMTEGGTAVIRTPMTEVGMESIRAFRS